MERIITEKEREMIINFGAFDYENQKMADILGWELEDVRFFMADKKSEFYKLFNQGKAKGDYVIDMKLFEMAQGGDMKAMSELEKRRKKDEF